MYDEYQAMTIVSNYLKDIQERFSNMIQETGLTEEQQEEVKKYLGYSITHSKDEKSIKDMSKEW